MAPGCAREVGWKGETETGRKHYDGATEISRMEGIHSHRQPYIRPRHIDFGMIPQASEIDGLMHNGFLKVLRGSWRIRKFLLSQLREQWRIEYGDALKVPERASNTEI
jgi:hypothetical protein